MRIAFALLALTWDLVAVAQTADVSVTATGPAAASIGATVTYSSVVTNHGPDTVSVSFRFGTGLLYLTMSPSPSTTCTSTILRGGGPPHSFVNLFECSATPLAPGATLTLTFSGQVPPSEIARLAGSEATVTVVAPANDPNEPNNRSVVLTQMAGAIPAMSPLTLALMVIALALVFAFRTT